VRAGRSLAPTRWRDNAQVAVALSIDPDHETATLHQGSFAPGLLSWDQYGPRVGTPRLLRLLDRLGVPVSIFVPAVSALLHPDEVRAWVAAGHEVGLHGWIHEAADDLPPAVERELHLRAAQTVAGIAGAQPVGYRAPSGVVTEHTLAILQQLGVRYDSSMAADDEPYELLADGQPTGLVEIPADVLRDDAPYFEFREHLGCLPPRNVLEIWRAEFDQAYTEGGLFTLMVHPAIIGHRSRIAVLAELLDHIASHDGVWFATHAQITDYVRSAAEPTH
jgi:peptidoglycan/xylan/chitin deacetylase (PgdA/CDA1 family)